MRTLSARIILGFAALTITFGVIIATLVLNLQTVDHQLIVTGKGYVPLALRSKELANRQDDLRNYLHEQLTEESKVSLALQNIERLRRARDLGVRETRKVLDTLGKEIEIPPEQFQSSEAVLEKIERAITAVGPLYDEVIAQLPLTTQLPLDQQVLEAFLLRPSSGDDKRAAAAAALERLRLEERKISLDASQLAATQQVYVTRMISRVLDNEQTVQIRTIYLGAAAVLLGLLVTISVVITLRPLRRLREGARRIAAGDYASRIPEKGPLEVLELAREFNSMGRAIEERERELVRAERFAATGKMARTIAHEVRNPLSSIELNMSLLEDELGSGDPSEARALCRAIHHEVDRLTVITEEYLAFGRLPKPRLAHEKLHPLVVALADFVREDLAARQINLVTELAPQDPSVQLDAGQIRQCLINLVRNAADAVAAKGSGTITLSTRVTDHVVEIAVADDGIGIPLEVQPLLFDPFFSNKEGGSGLGLALTQQIMRDHHGTVRVESMVGRGAVFTLTLPRSEYAAGDR